MPPDAQGDIAAVAGEHPFAGFVRTLGRGPGRSRALTRAEARVALTMVLAGEAAPEQVGAFLMLLRYRGEDAAEVAGLVEAARDAMGALRPVGCPSVDLDWPSYGAGRTRGAPWFLLAALALARSGRRVLMHGSNAFTRGMPMGEALTALGMGACDSRAAAAAALVESGFAYLPLSVLSPGLEALLQLRGLLGLRSPINTAARLLDPFDAGVGVDGVFHPPYIALHQAAAGLLGRRRLVVVKGGGGEAERNPARAMTAHWYDAAGGTGEVMFEPIAVGEGPEELVTTWRDGIGPGAAVAKATIGLALLALQPGISAASADAEAERIWDARLG